MDTTWKKKEEQKLTQNKKCRSNCGLRMTTLRHIIVGERKTTSLVKTVNDLSLSVCEFSLHALVVFFVNLMFWGDCALTKMVEYLIHLSIFTCDVR